MKKYYERKTDGSYQYEYYGSWAEVHSVRAARNAICNNNDSDTPGNYPFIGDTWLTGDGRPERCWKAIVVEGELLQEFGEKLFPYLPLGYLVIDEAFKIFDMPSDTKAKSCIRYAENEVWVIVEHPTWPSLETETRKALTARELMIDILESVPIRS